MASQFSCVEPVDEVIESSWVLYWKPGDALAFLECTSNCGFEEVGVVT